MTIYGRTCTKSDDAVFNNLKVNGDVQVSGCITSIDTTSSQHDYILENTIDGTDISARALIEFMYKEHGDYFLLECGMNLKPEYRLKLMTALIESNHKNKEELIEQRYELEEQILKDL
jgi:hypothetical protein